MAPSSLVRVNADMVFCKLREAGSISKAPVNLASNRVEPSLRAAVALLYEVALLAALTRL